MRRPTGGDPNRKALNLHHGVLIPDEFMRAVEADEEWALKAPRIGAVIARFPRVQPLDSHADDAD
jgi:ribonucleoside-diphosphate reductase alpha chain